jgi:hypothetical protein
LFGFELGLFSARLRSRLFSYPFVNTLVMFIFGLPEIGFVLYNLSKLVAPFGQEGTKELKVQSEKLKTAFRQENKVKNSKLWNASRGVFVVCGSLRLRSG